MSEGLVSILDGNTFVVSDKRGDIEASSTEPTGLFSYDTRFLSTWVLTIDGNRLNPLSTDDPGAWGQPLEGVAQTDVTRRTLDARSCRHILN